MDSMKNLSLSDVLWEDIFVPRILPHVTLQDCCNLSKLGEPYCKIVELYLHNIKVLQPHAVKNLNNDDFMMVASKTQQLEKLNLKSCSNVNSEIVKMFIEKNNSLTHINLSNTTSILDTALHNLIHSKNLQQLVLMDCDWITIECMSTLIHHLINLVYVNLENCPQVDARNCSSFVLGPKMIIFRACQRRGAPINTFTCAKGSSMAKLNANPLRLSDRLSASLNNDDWLEI